MRIRQQTIWRLLCIGGLLLAIVPQVAYAQAGTDEKACEINYSATTLGQKDRPIHLQVKIPGVTDAQGNVKNLGCYIVGIYKYFVGVAGILATVMMMYGGLKYVVSFGSQQKISEAKDTIVGAMMGLMILLSSYLILYFINPNLTKFSLDIGGITVVPDAVVWCDEYSDAVPDKPGAKDCGVTGTVMLSNDKGEKVKTACVYHGTCGNDVAGNKQICTPWGTGYACKAAQIVCEESSLKGVETCKRIDALMASGGDTDHVCAPDNFTFDYACKYKPLLSSCGDGYIPVSCDVGAGKESECWDATTAKPKSKGTYQCADGRVAFGQGAICCAWTGHVMCLDAGRCPEGLLQLTNCSINGISYVQPTGGGSSCTQADLSNGKVCCLSLKIENVNQ